MPFTKLMRDELAALSVEDWANSIADRIFNSCAEMLEEMARTAKANDISGAEALRLAASAFREKAKLQ